MLILMTDGSSKGNPGPIKIAFLLWDRMNNAGRFSKPTYKHSEWKGAGTNNEAEYMALIEGLKYICRKYKQNKILDEIYIYSDSQLVIKQINSEYVVKHAEMISLHAQVWREINHLRNMQFDLKFSWVPRQLIELANKECQQ